MKTAGFIIVLFFVTISSLVAQPIISTITPSSGGIGATVTITGAGFDATPANNIVYFGAVKATVSAGTTTSLTVTVPAGASSQPVSVTAAGLTAYSTNPFAIIFQGAYPSFSDSSFASRTDIAVTYPYISLCLADFDGDGKPDLVTSEGDNASGVNAGLHVFQNVGKPGKISFGTPQWYSFGGNNLSPSVLAIDVDGDGLLDLVVGDNGHHKIYVYRNTSSGGTISFDNPVAANVTGPLFLIASGDLDGDGKPDIVGGGEYGNVFLIKNTSAPGHISLTNLPDVSTASFIPMYVAITDMDGDNKPDIVVGLDPSMANPDIYVGFSILRNTSSGGNISFATATQPVANISGAFTGSLAVADLDGDGRKEVILTDSYGNRVFTYRNNSTPGTLSFGNGVPFPVGNTGAISATDIDGDGKPDLTVSSANGAYVLKNTSVSGTIAFAAGVGYITPGSFDYQGSPTIPNNLIGDIDGDGKPDMIVGNGNNSSLSFFRNKIAEPLIGSSGANPITGDVAQSVTVDATVQQVSGITYVQRHYDIEPANNPSTSTAHLKLYFSQPEFDAFNATPGHGADLPTGASDAAGKANLRIYQNHGFSATNTPGSYNGTTIVIDPDDGNINWNPGTQLWEVDFDVTGFSGFFISAVATSLPLKLLSFTAIAQDKNVALHWSTTNEVNTSRFDVQRSTDGNQFTTVATVKAAGNSSAVLNYQYVDTPGPRPVYYYRLNMTDIDGHASYSDIAQVTLSSNRAPLRVYPNPARDYITIEAPSANKAHIRLLDLSGQVLQKADIPKNNTQTRLSILGLASGTYKIIWTDGTKTLTQSLMIF